MWSEWSVVQAEGSETTDFHPVAFNECFPNFVENFIGRDMAEGGRVLGRNLAFADIQFNRKLQLFER